jgi:hypothetical protein
MGAAGDFAHIPFAGLEPCLAHTREHYRKPLPK